MYSHRAQASVEEMLTAPPEPPPAVAVVLDTLPDPLYDDVNTLKKVHSQSHFEIQLLLRHSLLSNS